MAEDAAGPNVSMSSAGPDALPAAEGIDTALKGALASLRLPFGDVLGEFGASDMTPVLVDGDELVLAALRSEAEAAIAGQWLPVVFCVCHRLRRLTLSHLKFRVFFLAVKQLAYPPHLLALRSAIIRHLQHATDLVVDAHLSAFGDAEWKNYIDLHLPSFVLTEISPETADGDDTPVALNSALAVYLVSHNVPTVVLTGLEMCIPRLHGFYLEAQNLPGPAIDAEVAAKVAAAMEQVAALPSTTSVSDTTVAHSPTAVADTFVAAAPNVAPALGWRLPLLASAARAAAAAATAEQTDAAALSALAILHGLALNAMTAEQRCLVLPAPALLATVPLAAAVPGYCRSLQLALNRLPVAAFVEAHPAWRRNEVDLLDGRVMQALALLFSARGVSPATLAKDLGLLHALPDAGVTALLAAAGCAEAWTAVPAADKAAATTAVEAATAAAAATGHGILALGSESALTPLSQDEGCAALLGDALELLKPRELEAYVATHLAEDEGALDAYGWHRGRFADDHDIFLRPEHESSGESQAAGKKEAAAQHKQHKRRQILIDRLKKLRAPVRLSDADPILDELETLLTPGYVESMRRLRRIGDLGNLIMLLPRWQTKLNPRRMVEKGVASLQKFAMGLIGGPVQNLVIVKESADSQKASAKIKTFNLNVDRQMQFLVKKLDRLEKLLRKPKKSMEEMQEELITLRSDPDKKKVVWDETVPGEMAVRNLAASQNQAAVAAIAKLESEDGFPARLRAFRARIEYHLMCITYQRWRAVHEAADARAHAAEVDAALRVELGQSASAAAAESSEEEESEEEDEAVAAEDKAKATEVTATPRAGADTFAGPVTDKSFPATAPSASVAAHTELVASASADNTATDAFALEAETFLVVPTDDVNRAVVLDEVLALVDLPPKQLGGPETLGVLNRLAWLGFPVEANVLLEQAKEAGAVPADAVLGEDKYAVSENETLMRFQLRCMGPYLGRPKGVRDARSPNFRPDKWQIDLLDAVDNRQSALISAPTSSGKTFISFYAMEKVLRATKDMDGYSGVDADSQVVIYVSPTKALVNQMEAEMYARFSKNYQSNSNMSLVGVFTQDYRSNPLTCQVLITVPSCLEVLLLSPQNEEWKRRIKWVVFDEVHCISMGSGQAWERLLQLIECPFLALSATMGNTVDFKAWLDHLEEARGRTPPKFIVHRQRWNDLDLWVYHMDKHALVPMNPLGLLNADTVAVQGTCPSELKLLPEHCIQTYELLGKLAAHVATQRGDAQPHTAVLDVLHQMGPEANRTHLQQYGRITMAGAEQYEAAVKTAVSDLARVDRPLLAALLAALRGNVAAAALPTPTEDLVEGKRLLKAIRQLGLETPSKLPAICFHLNVAGIHELVEALTQAMLREQEDDDLRKHGFTQWDDAAARAHKLEKLDEKLMSTARNNAQRRAEEELDNMMRMDENAARDVNLDDLVEKWLPLEEAKIRAKREGPYCIAGMAVPLEDIKEAFGGRIWENELGELMRTDPFFQALRRGIGMHYKELSNKKRKAVEHLFRCKKLSVVFATDTLALGISMPCRSVVFMGDSPFLDPQSYHQMAGRAGRRGFDKRGHVIFYGLGLNKTSRLLTSPLRNMTGNVPLDVSTTSRALLCYQGTKKDERREAVARQMQRLLRFPFYTVHEPLYSSLAVLYARGTLDLLVRAHFLVFEPARSEKALEAAAPAHAGDVVDQQDAAFQKAIEEENRAPEGTGVDDWDCLASSDEEEEPADTVAASSAAAAGDAPPGAVVGTVPTAPRPVTTGAVAVPAYEGPRMGACGSMAAHHFYLEPHNLPLVYFLTTGKFDELLAAAGDNVALFKKQMIHVLALHGFFVRVHPLKVAAMKAKRGNRRVPTMVVLDPLPPALATAAAEFNALSRDALVRILYNSAFVHEDLRKLLHSTTLPATSSTAVEGETGPLPAYSALDASTPAAEALLGMVKAPLLRSCLSGISGRGDVFADAVDVAESVPPLPGLHPALVGHCSTEMTLNAYVYDFWLHGNSRIIEEDNELTTHQQYDKLRAFKNHLTLFAQAVSKRAKGDKRDENQVSREKRQRLAGVMTELAVEFETKLAESDLMWRGSITDA